MEENHQDKKFDLEQASDFEFLQEKIKERPIDKKKLLQRTVVTASLALLFGLVACLTFLVLEPVLNNWLYPEEEPEQVTFPQEKNEMLPEDMLTEGEVTTQEESTEAQNQNMFTNSAVSTDLELEKEAETVQENQSEEGTSIYISEYQTLYAEMRKLYENVSSSIVTVTAVKSDVDWFNNTYQSEGSISGVIVANNNKELLILTKRSLLKGAESLEIRFENDTTAEGIIKKYDITTDLAIIAVDLKNLKEDTLKMISVAALGSSLNTELTGTPIMAVGSIQGYKDNVCYGMITSMENVITLADNQYKLITTDIYGSQSPTGFLINMDGKIIGIIDNTYNHSDTKNLVSAVGITELKGLITKLSNGSDIPYVGLYVQDIAENIRSEAGLPQGAYISDIDMDSPGMVKGIQKGDIVVGVDGKEILTASDYMNAIRSCEVGQEVEISVRRSSQQAYELMTFSVQPIDRK